MKKVILDTNIFISNPNAMFEFKSVLIPDVVIKELIKFEDELSYRGKSSRDSLKNIEMVSGIGDISDTVNYRDSSFRVIFCKNASSNTDEDLIRLSSEYGAELITNDISLRVRANIHGVKTSSYKKRYVSKTHPICHITSKDSEDVFGGTYPMSGGVNEYSTLMCNNRSSILVRSNSDGLAVPLLKKKIYDLLPRNREQFFAIDALCDQSAQLVALEGRAGTGKTLLAMAAGIEGMISCNYDQVIICRATVSVGREMGYLPGDVSEKMSPWMGSIKDNMQTLSESFNRSIEKWLSEGKIAIEPLAFMRGRSFKDKYIIIDEAQNMNEHEMKTVITRAGEGCKVVITGDTSQIDAHWLDKYKNGLTHVIARMRGQKLFRTVFLTKAERGELSELASRLL
jgi:PhoH-like ATPase